MIIDYPSSSSMGHGEIPYRPMDGGLKYVFFLIIYPLENAYITMDKWTNPPFSSWVNPLFLWSFSIAMLNYHGVMDKFIIID